MKRLTLTQLLSKAVSNEDRGADETQNLESSDKYEKGEIYLFPEGLDEMTMGRSEACYITISSGYVSRVQCKIRRENMVYFLEDEISKNRTHVNEEPVGKEEPKELKDGDILRINNIEFEVGFEGD